MPNASHETTVLGSGQSASAQPDDWEQEVLARLPDGWELQAKKLGAFRRSRQVRSPKALLRGLLMYILSTSSFRQLGVWSVRSPLADISETARSLASATGRGVVGLAAQRTVGHRSLHHPNWSAKGCGGSCCWMARTCADYRKNGKIWRRPRAFDLLAGRLTQVQIPDTSQGENWNRFCVHQGDLLVSDRINGYQERIAWVVQQMAHLIVRCSPTALPLDLRDGRRVEVINWLKSRHAPAGRVCCCVVWVQTELLWVLVRLIALRLTPEQQQKAERRVR